MTHRKASAISVVVLVVLSMTIPGVSLASVTSSGNTGVGNVSTAPGVDAPDATIDDGTTSTIEVAYRLNSSVNPGDYTVKVYGPETIYANVTVPDAEDTVTFDVRPGQVAGGNHTYRVELVNNSASPNGRTDATDTGNLTVESPVVMENYSLSTNQTYVGKKVTATATLTNTGSSSAEYLLAMYDDRDGSVLYNTDARSQVETTVTVAAGATKTVQLNQSWSYAPSDPVPVRVNDGTVRNVTVDEALGIQSTSLSTSDALVGETVTLDVTVKNRGGDGTYDVTVSDYGAFEKTKSVTLAHGETTTLSYSFSYSSAGEKRVSVDYRDSVSLSVTNPVNVTSVSLSSTTVQVGESVTVTATAVNTADTAGTYPVVLQSEWGRTQYGSTDVQLDPGEEKTVSFSASFGKTGTLYPRANNKTTVVTVTNPVNVTDYSVGTASLYVGESTTVSATVENTGSSSGTYPVLLQDESGDVIAQTDVTLSAGGTTTVSLSPTFDRPADSVSLNNVSDVGLTVDRRVQVASVDYPGGVETGETASVDVTLENPTGSSGTVYYDQTLGGDYDAKRVTVSANGKTQISISGTFDTPGTKHAFVLERHLRVFVLNDTTGSAEMNVQAPEDATAVVDTESGFVVAVENTGTAAGITNVSLSIDGTSVGSKRVAAEPGGTANAYFEFNRSTTGNYTVTVSANGTTHTANLTVIEPVVKDATVSHVDGTAPSSLPIAEAHYSQWGGVWVVLKTGSGWTSGNPYELGSLGVDHSTTFEVELAVRDYQPRTLVSTGEGAEMNVTERSGELTNVTVTITPTDLNFARNPPSLGNWGDRNLSASYGLQSAVFMNVGNGESRMATGDPQVIDGLTIASDAQRFSQPRYFPGDGDTPPRIEAQVGAPHWTVDGELNTGYYTAVIPDSLLEEWGASASDLTVTYTADDSFNYTVTEVEGGVKLSVTDIHYSSGTISVSTSGGSSGDGGGSSGGGSSSLSTATATPSPTPTATPTATDTATESSTATPTPTDAPDGETATPTPTEPSGDDGAGSGETTTADGPGFGLGAVVAALALVALLGRRRR